MRNNVAIYGGFAGNETSLAQRSTTFPSSTTLSGDIGTTGTTVTTPITSFITQPVWLTSSAVLDGLVITGGNANGI